MGSAKLKNQDISDPESIAEKYNSNRIFPVELFNFLS
jgi:hypothetical protein